MIAPDMATMLGYVFTDAAVEPAFLQAAAWPPPTTRPSPASRSIATPRPATPCSPSPPARPATRRSPRSTIPAPTPSPPRCTTSAASSRISWCATAKARRSSSRSRVTGAVSDDSARKDRPGGRQLAAGQDRDRRRGRQLGPRGHGGRQGRRAGRPRQAVDRLRRHLGRARGPAARRLRRGAGRRAPQGPRRSRSRSTSASATAAPRCGPATSPTATSRSTPITAPEPTTRCDARRSLRAACATRRRARDPAALAQRSPRTRSTAKAARRCRHHRRPRGRGDPGRRPGAAAARGGDRRRGSGACRPVACSTGSATALCWIIDPLDGTHNFAAGKPPFGILVALAERRRDDRRLDLRSADAAASAMPRRGGGAFVDGERIAARDSGADAADRGDLADLHGPGAARGGARGDRAALPRWSTSPAAPPSNIRAWRWARTTSSIFERTLPWDHAAGVLLLNEAGGKAARPDGRAYRVDEWHAPGPDRRGEPERCGTSWRRGCRRLQPRPRARFPASP